MSRKIHYNVDGTTLCARYGLSATVITIIRSQVTCKACLHSLDVIDTLRHV